MRCSLGTWILAFMWLAAPGSPGAAEDARSSERFSARARFLFGRADTLFLRQRADSALTLLRSVRQEAGRSGQRPLELEALFREGAILSTIGQAAPAEAALRPVLDAAIATRDTLRRCQSLRFLAWSVGMQGRTAESVSLWQQLLDLSLTRADRAHEAYARLGLAYATMIEGRPSAARAGYERAIALFREQGNTRFELIALTGLGRCLDGLGDLAGARARYLEAARRSEAFGDPFTQAHALNNLGAIESRVGDPAAAVQDYARAIELQLANGNPEGSISPACNNALALIEMDQYEDAAAVLERAREICRRNGYLAQQAMVLEELGTVRRRQDRYVDAAALYRSCLALGKTVSPKISAEALQGLAITLASMDSTAAALGLLAREFEPLRPRLPPSTLIQLDRTQGELLLDAGQPQPALRRFLEAERTATRAGLTAELPGTLALSGRAWLTLGHPDSALASLTRGSKLWDAARTRSRDLEWREQMGQDGRVLYSKLAAVMLEYPPERPEPERTRAAFDALQRFKARTLRERMHGPAEADSEGGVATTAITLAELQEQVLGERELLLDAFLGARESLIFAVNRRECRIIHLPGADDGLGARLVRYHALLAQAQSTPDEGELRESAASSLGDLLLAPVADMIRESDRLLIAPDGGLNLIPFSTLPFTDPATGRLAPLLTTHEVVQVASASLLGDLRRPSRRNLSAPAAILAVAGPPDSTGRRLRGAEEEVRGLERRFRGVVVMIDRARAQGDASRDTTAIAAESDLAGVLGHYGLLHFAAHTRIDDVHPWRSGIVVSTKPQEGGILRAYRIAALRLPARLAILSGCESGRGRVLSGEGVLGLTTAFAAAGVPAVVSTLWPVSDRATTRLMRAFYEALARGETAASSLRTAQLRLRGDPGTSDPFFWAGFVLLGDGEVRFPLVSRPPRQLEVILPAVLGLAALLLAGWAGKRRSRRKVSR